MSRCLIATAIWGVLGTSCSQSLPFGDVRPIPGRIRAQVELVEVAEFGARAHVPVLHLETVHQFEYYEYEVVYDVRQVFRDVVIAVRGARLDCDICHPAFGPARTDVRLRADTRLIAIVHNDSLNSFSIDSIDGVARLVPLATSNVMVEDAD